MDHARPEIAATEKTASARPMPACAECLAPFTPRQASQLFCCTDHKNAFHDRCRIRGRQLVPLEMAVSITRNGRTRDKEAGVLAARSAQRLKRQWAAEDRAACRMPMDQYIRRMIRHHDLP